METFWTSAIIYDKGNTKPWLCAKSSPQFSLDRAKREIEQLKKKLQCFVRMG